MNAKSTRTCAALAWLFIAGVAVVSETPASLILSGRAITYTGPGSYDLPVFVQSVGTETIAGFNIPIDLVAVPGVSFDSFIDAGSFDDFGGLANPTLQSDYLVGGAQIGSADHVLHDGDQLPLFSLRFVVDATASITGLTPLAAFGSDTIFPLRVLGPGATPITIGSFLNPPALTVAAIPEPASWMLFGFVAALTAVRRGWRTTLFRRPL